MSKKQQMVEEGSDARMKTDRAEGARSRFAVD